jgi:hypothetical protein
MQFTRLEFGVELDGEGEGGFVDDEGLGDGEEVELDEDAVGVGDDDVLDVVGELDVVGDGFPVPLTLGDGELDGVPPGVVQSSVKPSTLSTFVQLNPLVSVFADEG